MYIPNNQAIFIAAYAGALAGMGVSDRVVTDTNPSDYSGLASVAGAFAQCFDQLYPGPVNTLSVQTVEEICETAWQERSPNAQAPFLTPATYTPLCNALIAILQAGLAYFTAQGVSPNVPGSGGSLPLMNISANTANADIYPDKSSVTLRTGSNANPAGAFNGGGTGNKSMLGLTGYSGLSIAALTALSYTFKNLLGPGGPFFVPPGGPTVTTPYCNLIVDFDPLGAGDLRVLALMDDSLNPLITASIGTYVNALNILTYSWAGSQNEIGRAHV